MNNTQKFLELQVNSEGILFYITFNDIEVISGSDRNENTIIPLNHWSLNGGNHLLISAELKSEDTAERLATANTVKLTASLVLREKKGEHEKSYVLSTFDLGSAPTTPDAIASRSSKIKMLDSSKDYQASESGDVLLSAWHGKPVGEWHDTQQTVKIDLGLPKWAIEEAEIIRPPGTSKMPHDDYIALIKEVYGEYKKIWSLMQAKDIDTLLPLFKARAGEMEKAFYLPAGEKYDDMQRSLQSAFNHETLELEEFARPSEVTLSVGMGGRLALVKFKPSGEPIINYAHKEGHFTRFYNMYFMKKDGKWSIIR